MTQREYFARMEDIRRLRDRIMDVLAKDAAELKSTFLGDLEGLLAIHPDLTVDEYVELIRTELKITPGKARQLKARLEAGQLQLAAERAEVLAGIVGAVNLSPLEVQALYHVNFPKLNAELVSQVKTHLADVINRKGSYREVIASLKKTEIASYQARTMVNTALAGFDNAYSSELAKKSGIETFRYMGMAAQRPFCQTRLGNDYTRAEISQMDNGQGLPVFAYCGGYNCVHQWVANPFKEIHSL